ncbi:nuclear pore protein 84/107 [Martensiomyces pterosporus]|nr:nuclear pore protein 84/107 [Martensiomyces pterosporus]
MSISDITAEFAGVVESHDDLERSLGASDHRHSHARLFSSLAQKQCEQLAKDAYAANEAQRRGQMKYWKTESNTWDLMERLYFLRLQALADAAEEEGSSMADDPSRGQEARAPISSTDFTCVQDLMDRSSLLAECVEVRRWLEENAPSFEPVETRKGYLFYTRKSIRDRRLLPSNSSAAAAASANSGRIVSEADPDATSRQKRELAPEDSEYEGSLLRTLYEYVRRGHVSSAMDLCVESDEPWRAASLKGGLFWRDPKLELENNMPIDAEDSEGGMDVRPLDTAGNINRPLWKQTCAALAQDNSNDLYERALYAALSGRLDEVILVCESWEDYVWAYVNAMIETCIDKGIKNENTLYTPAPSTSFSHVQSRYPPIRDMKQVFDALATHESALLRQESSEPFHRLQSAIVLDTLPAFIDDYACRLRSEELSDEESGLLRFVVHSALYLRQIGFALPSEAVDTVLEEYIAQLSTGHRELVALYASYLPQHKQVDVYSQFLQGVADPAPVRVQFLQLAKTSGLDVDPIAKRAADLILLRHAVVDGGEDSSGTPDSAFALAEPAEPITDDELDQLRAIEWITSSQRLYEYALVQICKLARRFLLRGRTNAASQLFNSLPDDFVQQKWSKNAASVSSETVSYLHEYIHLLSLCDAYAYYSTWAEVLCKRPMDAGKQGARLHAQWLEWRESVALTTERAIHMFRASLLDIDWLSVQSLCIRVDDVGTADSQQPRIVELLRLRELYIPETVFRLHSILFDTREPLPHNLQRSLDLAQLVADESLGIYHEMVKASPSHPRGRLAAFMSLMRQSAFEILRVQQESHGEKPLLLSDSAVV